MKFIVAHSDRQYCNHLLVALAKRGWLVRFYTLFSANRLWGWPRFFPKKMRDALRKRAVDPEVTPHIRHFPALFLAGRLFGKNLVWAIQNTYVWFDRRVAQRLAKADFDAVVTYENANLHTHRAAKRLGKITVLDLAQIHHDDIAQYGQWFMPPDVLQAEIAIINPRKSEALAHTDYVLTLSSFAAESMLRHGWPAERLFTVRLGVDVQRFSAKPEYRQLGPLRLLFVGTLTRRKGLEVLFKALAQLPEAAFDLTLIGPVSDAGDLLREHAGRFRHLPFQHHEALADHYRQADVFVFPSLLDSWGQTVLEAMACGTPAIVTENTGARDAVQQGGGWVIPTNDVPALENAIRYCLNNRAVVEEKGKLAHQTARQYTWENYQKNLLAIFDEISRYQSHLGSPGFNLESL
ncbi:MAG: glycosyltransferase family 4 protein [Saprospiraceae bacterium]